MTNIAIHDLHPTDAGVYLEQEISNVDTASIYGGFLLHIGKKFELRIGGDRLHIDINHPH